MFTSMKRSFSTLLALSAINFTLVISSSRIQETETLAKSITLATLAGLVFALSSLFNLLGISSLSSRPHHERESEPKRAVTDRIDVSVKRAHVVQIIGQQTTIFFGRFAT